MNFRELLENQRNEAGAWSKNKIYWIFAGTELEFKRKLNELNLNPDDLISIGAGGYLLKEYKQEFYDLLDRQENERYNYTINHVYEVVKHYLWDYEMEISISLTLDDLLHDIIGLSDKDIKENANIINKAIDDYKKEFYECN